MPLDDTSSGLDSILKQVGSLSDTLGKQTAPEMAEMRSLEKQGREAITSLEQETGKKLPEPPRLGELPKAPNVQPGDPMEALGQPLTVLAIFASLLTRQPLTTALDSAGKAIEGFRAGRMDAAQLAYEQYRTAMDQVFKQHAAEMSDYRALMEEHGQTIRGKAAVLEAIGSAHGWTEARRLAKAGQVDEAIRIVQTNEQLLQRLQHEKFLELMFEQGRTPEQQILNQWKREFRAQNGRDPTAEEEAKFRRTSVQKEGSPQTQMLDRFREFYREQNGRDPTPNEEAAFMQKLRPPRSVAATALQKHIDENPNEDADALARWGQDYAAHAKAVSAFAAGKEAGIVRSFNTATEHIGTMRRLAEDLKNSDTVAFNKVAQAWGTQFGATAPNNFNSAKQIVGDEIVKAIVGAGGGVSDREKAQSILDAARTPQQLSEAMDTLTELMGGQLKGLRKQWEDSTGRPGEEFDRKLTGAAREALMGATIAEPTTQAEYDALPSGARFRDDEGVKVKP